MDVESGASPSEQKKLKNHHREQAVAAGTGTGTGTGIGMITSNKRKTAGRWCACVTLGVITAVVLVVVIVAVTVFKPKHPVTRVNHVSLRNVHASFDIARLQVHLNLTVDAEITVHNPNKVGFKYKNGSALLNYKGKLVGEAPIPAGDISPDSTQPMNITLYLMADRLLSNSQIYSEALGGALPLNTYSRLSGKVRILRVFKFHVVTSTSCDFVVFLSNTTIGDQTCSYNTKF